MEIAMSSILIILLLQFLQITRMCDVIITLGKSPLSISSEKNHHRIGILLLSLTAIISRSLSSLRVSLLSRVWFLFLPHLKK
jgi:hypothetical protein